MGTGLDRKERTGGVEGRKERKGLLTLSGSLTDSGLSRRAFTGSADSSTAAAAAGGSADDGLTDSGLAAAAADSADF